MGSVIPRKIVPSVEPAGLTPAEVARELRALLEAGARLRPAGAAKDDPAGLLSRYAPKHKIELFDTRFYLTFVRQIPELRFFVAYVVQVRGASRKPDVYPRIFYKDVSLVWRAASHLVRTTEELWIGKGDVTTFVRGEDEYEGSMESTTDLPLEIQTALEMLSRQAGKVRTDFVALDLVLRRAPSSRIAPYSDFIAPRRQAAANPRNLVNGGKPVAFFSRNNDPTSLRFVAGFEPDFDRGVIDVSYSQSGLYGGKLARHRILSKNRQIQYLFFAGPHQVWIVPPQATTTELSIYGVRTIDVVADEDLFVPGFEYHYLDDSEDPPVLISQIPEGFVGEECHHGDGRADASPWLDKLPVVREFRRKVLARKGGARLEKLAVASDG
jgi:hypothetical protein